MPLNALAATSDINTYIAAANDQIALYGKQILNPDVFYSKQLLDTIRLDASHYLYYRYADMNPIAGKANKLQVRRWAPLRAHSIPLVEGVPPTSDKGSVEMYEIETDQYGRYMEFSDKVDFKVVDPVIAHYTREYSIVAMETLDLLARETMFSLANKVYAGYVAGFENLITTSAPTMTDLRKIVLSLKKQLVNPRSNGKYHVVAGAEFYFDMISDPTVEKYMTYNQTTKGMYENSMLVPLFNMEFYETLVCPTHGKFTTIVETVAKQSLRIYASDGAGGYSYLTLTEDTLIKTATDAVGVTPVAVKREAGYELDSRTGLAASYIPEDARTVAQGAEVIFDLAAFNAAANATDGDNSVGNASKTWYEFKAQHVLVLGKDALIRTGIENEGNAQVYTKAKGSTGVLDPIDQRQSIGFKINDVGFGSARTEAIVDYVCVPSQVNLI